MAERPSKRPKRTDSTAMWEQDETRNGKITNGTRHHDRREREGSEELRHRDRSRNRERRRSRSHSRDRHGAKSRRDDGDRMRRRRSRSRERDRDRDRDRDHRDKHTERPREHRDKRDRDRSRSPERKSKGDDRYHHRTERRRSRSRSPIQHRRHSPKPRETSPPRSRDLPKNQPTNGLHKPEPGSKPPTGPRGLRQAADSEPKSEPVANGETEPAQSSDAAPPSKTDEMDLDSDPEVAAMQKIMGFTKFKTTKQTKVPGNDWYGVRKEKKTEYRQYMNRVGGFNRPLSPSR